MRQQVVLVIAVSLVVCSTASSAQTSLDGCASPPPRDPELTLRVRMTVASDLPSSARATLRQEAETIWRREGVRVQWLSPDDDEPGSGVVLRVLVGHVLARAREGEAWPVGQLLSDQAGDRIAIASISAARRVLALAGLGKETSARTAYRLGLVLGRTVAHEIGHYLLGTGSHARRGLMRARIDARDFVDLRDGAFFLDGVASRWIRDVLRRGVTLDTQLARFTY